jgi:hypothetical protein
MAAHTKPHGLVLALLAASVSASGPVLAAPASFQQAVAEYNGGFAKQIESFRR